MLRYRPSDEPLDYLVAYQAAFLVRLFECPAQRRFDFIVDSSAAERLLPVLLAGRRLDDHDARRARQFAAIVSEWSLMNLRSLPIGMRVDQWLHDRYPDLRELQKRGVERTLQAALDVVGQRVDQLSVPPHLLGMDAAYALFAQRLLGLDAFTVAYEAAGAIATGESLLALSDESSREAVDDRLLVDSWAASLGMTGWYHWQTYEP